MQYAPWTALILPYIDQAPLYGQLDFNVPFQEASNQMAQPNLGRIVPLSVYQCPSNTRTNVNPLFNSYYGVQGGGAAAQCSGSGCSPAGERAHFVNGILYAGSRTRMADIEDGSSNVYLVGETRYANAAWGASAKQDSCSLPQNIAGAQEPINLHAGAGIHSTRGFSSYHTGGCHMLMADGAVLFVSENIDLASYRQIAIMADGRPVGGNLP